MSSGREQDPEYQSKEEYEAEMEAIFGPNGEEGEDSYVDEIEDDEEYDPEDLVEISDEEDYNQETGPYHEDDIEAEPPPDMSAKFPNIHVKLIGRDGNAFAILGAVRKELRRGSVSDEDIKQFMDEATNGDYNHLLATCMKWVTVE